MVAIFENAFHSILDRLEGGQAALLMGFDGISVVSVIKPGAACDTELMGAEVSAIVSQLRQAAFTKQFGMLEDFTFSSSTAKVLLHVMTPDYFVAVVAAAATPIGKARFLLAQVEDELKAALG